MSSLNDDKGTEKTVVKDSTISFDEEKQFEQENGEITKSHHILDKIGLKFNAEIRGIERVPESQRTDTSLISPLTMFLSPNMSIAAIGTGALGPALFDLDFWTCVIISIVFSIIGALPVGFYTVFGMKFGLRQMILSRYLTGNIPARIFALLNVISCIGWNAINSIGAVELLCAVGPLPPWAGCLIIVIITSFIALFGYKVIHVYEKYSWIPSLFVSLVIIARLKISHDFEVGKMTTGKTEIGNVLTFISVVFGFVAGWVPSSADYSVYMPSNTKSWKVFFAMFCGLVIPSIFTLILGSAMAMGINSNERWAELYEKNSIGGLTYGILVEDSLHGFGKFCCVLLGLSSIANNLPGSYSLSLSTQAMWSKLEKFPRLGWCILGNCITLGISIPAYYVFSEAMQNFLSIIGYNVSIYLGISLSEHFIFRRSLANYDYMDNEYTDFNRLPIGIAGGIALVVGWVFAVMGMDQTWFNGFFSRHIGEYGGDIGWEVCIASTFVVYMIVRPFEKKYFGR